MLMLDLFSGLGGASRAMREAGWTVIRVDIEEKFSPDICCDIRDFHYSGPVPDLIWASPPCTEFSRRAMPPTWKCNGGKHKEPDMSCVLATKRIIEEINPKWWIVENVQGARKYFKDIFGNPVKRCGSRYLWGDFPICDPAPAFGKWKLPPSPDRAALRSIIPIQISKAVRMSCEAYI
jgi:site-specific DNA-cytosine methylase